MAFVSNWDVNPLWYPKRKGNHRVKPTKKDELSVKRMIMADAYKQGFNPKEIAGYFRIGVWVVYKNIPVKELKELLTNANKV